MRGIRDSQNLVQKRERGGRGDEVVMRDSQVSLSRGKSCAIGKKCRRTDRALTYDSQAIRQPMEKKRRGVRPARIGREGSGKGKSLGAG